jgi:hypothetical protein
VLRGGRLRGAESHVMGLESWKWVGPHLRDTELPLGWRRQERSRTLGPRCTWSCRTCHPCNRSPQGTIFQLDPRFRGAPGCMRAVRRFRSHKREKGWSTKGGSESIVKVTTFHKALGCVRAKRRHTSRRCSSSPGPTRTQPCPWARRPGSLRSSTPLQNRAAQGSAPKNSHPLIAGAVHAVGY